MRAGRTGGRDRVVWSLGSIGHGHDAGSGVQRDDGNKIRMDAVGALLLIELRDLPFPHHHAAHAGSDDDADPVRVFFGHQESGIGQRLFGGHEGKLSVAIHSLGLDAVDVPFGGEVVDLAGDLGAVSVHGKGVEPRNGGDPGSPRQCGFPEFTHPDTDRGDDPQSCHHDRCPHSVPSLLSKPLSYLPEAVGSVNRRIARSVHSGGRRAHPCSGLIVKGDAPGVTVRGFRQGD